MKAIILAAGRGSRLDKYTKDLPKGMLSLFGKTLIERQIGTYRRNGITDISIVTGYKSEKINYEGVKYYHNKEWEDTNMLVSLMCASDEFNDDVIVSYSDIVFDDKVLQGMMNSNSDYAVGVDKDWRPYWEFRYGTVFFDLEELKINDKNEILSLGRETKDPNDCDARYIGILKFSINGINNIREILEKVLTEFKDKPWQVSGKTGRKAYMTDLLQELLDRKCVLSAVIFERGWYEFDTNEDYEVVLKNIVSLF